MDQEERHSRGTHLVGQKHGGREERGVRGVWAGEHIHGTS